ncbi:MAG: hypothetical protein KA354_11725 [Phycisphaerae bacterium]|nr:hypothetical protein [Phycisphaerae bacterium]
MPAFPCRVAHRTVVVSGLILVAGILTSSASGGPEGASKEVRRENPLVTWVLGADGATARFAERAADRDYAAQAPRAPFARLKKAGKDYAATSVAAEGDNLKVAFGDSGVTAVLRVVPKGRYFLIEVVSVSDEQLDELTFCDVQLTLAGKAGEPFAACALARNLKTNVHELPGPNARLKGMCYPRFGLTGASLAIIGCPASELRAVMQEVVRDAPELPHSTLGGPWAMDAPINQGSYLFNFGDCSEKNVEDWIRVARATGMNQIDFHGGGSFRFGDLRPNPVTYPKGRASFKVVIDRLHAAGIAAGLHTYAFFLDKHAEWVSPTPDPRLAKDAIFTLAEDLTAEALSVPVLESTDKMSTLTSFFTWNSVTLQIDDELVTYAAINKQSPFAFTQCQRGAWGTRVTPHAKGAKVQHLKECFGLFVPDGDSSLFAEVAARTADMFSECGFDMIYLDALDGEGIIGGPENGWHYGSRFTFEICKRLKKPALMEMSTFHHHLWYVRSRYVAWDHPQRAYKKFVDLHCHANQESRRMFLPGHLGWWAVKTWSGPQIEATFPDDIEYLCCKCLGTDTGLSLQGIDTQTIRQVPAFQRLAAIMRQYEDLRHRGHFPESVKSALRVPGDEYRLVPVDGGHAFLPVQHARHKVTGLQDGSARWQVVNKFGPQTLRLRIEALHAAGAYDAPGNPVVVDFREPGAFAHRSAAPGMAADLTTSADPVKVGDVSGRFEVSNRQPTDGQPSWVAMVRKFTPPLDLSRQQALGLWVHGDGQGEVLNFQLRSPDHVSTAIGDHYVKVDFTGWRYFELVEPEGDRVGDYPWPYGGSIYGLYREVVNHAQVETLGVWMNNVPRGKEVTCHLSPIKAIPLVEAQVANPTLSVAGQRLTFPVTIDTGGYLEFNSSDDCTLYGRRGEPLGKVRPTGDVPVLQSGENPIEFSCAPPATGNARVRVTVTSQGGTFLK